MNQRRANDFRVGRVVVVGRGGDLDNGMYLYIKNRGRCTKDVYTGRVVVLGSSVGVFGVAPTKNIPILQH